MHYGKIFIFNKILAYFSIIVSFLDFHNFFYQNY